MFYILECCTFDFVGSLYDDTSPSLPQTLVSLGRKNDAPGGPIVVAYFSDVGEMTHMGILIEEDRVLSKFGQGRPYYHQIEYIPEEYGTQYALFSYRGSESEWQAS